MAPGPVLRVAAFDELDAATLYALLRLRVDVFVVEQGCPYPELDGRDTEPSARHLWLEQAGTPVAYLRLLREPDGAARIGRVVVAGPARGGGLAGELITAGLRLAGDRPCVLEAQAHLVNLYRRYGFVPTGPEYVADGIPHVTMRRAPGPVGPQTGTVGRRPASIDNVR